MAKKTDDGEWLRLPEALRRIANDPATAWMPISRLRSAVRNGEVPSRRSGPMKHAIYFVRIADLKKAIVEVAVQ
jgi:hypothetical protein